ncbi:MAG: amidase family protein, partial [Acidobacteria bacterium]|nr:amidase family protein [Acidobacteriota bacterium]
MPDREICFLTATELSRLVRARELSAGEVLEAHLSQIDRLNPRVNAIVTLVADRARQQARAADRALAAGNEAGPLHGLPIAHKDLVWTRGIRTTFGTLACKDFVPTRDALIVERLKQAGAVTIGKTNTPEFGAGSQTFNPVFGETRNPYDTSKTCGGSSGGAAVALACGMQPLADGSDTGGSLRNPANFCNVVGLRPSPGRVPIWPSQAGWYTIGVQGPMARTVGDAALMLSAISGPDRRSPISISESGSRFAAPLDRDFRKCRIAWSPNLGGLPVDPRVTRVLESQRQVFESLGCRPEERTPDLKEADAVFRAWRAWRFELTLSALNHEQQSRLKETLKQEIEAARKLSGIDLSRAELRRTQLYHRVREFMETYEFLVCPVNQVPPFDVKQPYVEEINGVRMKTYIDWMRSCWT